MGDGNPPIFKFSGEIYLDKEKADQRYSKINELFTQKYGHAPQFYARAPGRVNIIGEHIDYCGYAVFPMALEQDIVFAVSTNDSKIYKMTNTNAIFQDYECDVKNFQITKNEWYHYLLCGHQALLDDCNIENPIGMNVIVDGIVPKSAGLSSSSALVCCSGLATMYANKKSLDKLTLADACTRCEKYVGIEGGGMDQAISYLAEKGTAKLIEFNPLKATNVPLPKDATFVIANSLREMNKSENPGEYYNKRVVECRLSAQILSKRFGHEWRKCRRLVDTQNILGKTLPEMVELVEKEFHKEPYNREEICKELQIPDDELIKECLNTTTANATSFKLYHRAKHVYSEADRVWTFKRICDERRSDCLEVLGALMNASQESCSKDYECSCKELDELTQICRESGALGSRLTGAGWGGCTVSMVPSDEVVTFVQKVKAMYYDTNEKRRDQVVDAIFSTNAGSGAAVIDSSKP